MPALSILISIKPSDGEEVRNLPDKKNHEKCKALWVESAPNANPSNKWWHSAGNSTDERIPSGELFKWCVNKHIRNQCKECEYCGKDVRYGDQ